MAPFQCFTLERLALAASISDQAVNLVTQKFTSGVTFVSPD